MLLFFTKYIFYKKLECATIYNVYMLESVLGALNKNIKTRSCYKKVLSRIAS